jgi:hypothetical protein
MQSVLHAKDLPVPSTLPHNEIQPALLASFLRDHLRSQSGNRRVGHFAAENVAQVPHSSCEKYWGAREESPSPEKSTPGAHTNASADWIDVGGSKNIFLCLPTSCILLKSLRNRNLCEPI